MSHQSDLISQDILAYLNQHEQKDLLRFLTCGNVDDGKSTLIGRLLYDSKLIYEDQLQAVTRDSKKVGTTGDAPDLALLVDGLQAEREQGITEQVVACQLDAVIELEGIEALTEAVIAYEPVWAIGTGKTASPEQAQAVHAFIRAKLAALNSAVAEKVQILYGGSVKGSNAAELFAMPDIDGGLIGGASLDAQEFLAICRAGN